MENKEYIEIICIILTTIATAVLVWIAFRQTSIQKTQTDIQNKALDISLLEQRLECFYQINVVRSPFLADPGELNKQMFYTTASETYTTQEVVQKGDNQHTIYCQAILNSKYLFSDDIYCKLLPTIESLTKLRCIEKELICKLNSISNEYKNGNDEAIKKAEVVKNIIAEIESGKSDTYTVLLEICNMSIDEYNQHLNVLKKIFFDDELFKSFDVYLDTSTLK